MAEKLPSGKEIVLPTALPDTGQLGRLVQAVRKEQGMTQFELAGLAGCGNRFIVDLEKGKPTVQAQKALDVLALLGLEVVVRRKGIA